MFEKLTDRARTVMGLANAAAQQLGDEYIGTEHILLGLLREGGGVAANILKHMGEGVSETRILASIRPVLVDGKLVDPRPAMASTRLPNAPRAKHVVESAMEEARQLGHNYVGTEHLLLGLLRQKESVAATLLLEVAPLEEFRTAVHDLLGTPKDQR
jgi:ATP-dependent Clp protease ATP-binding subunit ClpC